MNKNFKKKIVVLSAMLLICPAQNSKPVSAANKNLIKIWPIGIPLLIGSAGLIWGGFELANYLKGKSNNDTEIEDPGFIKDTSEIRKAKKLMDDALKQEWYVFVDSELFCKHIGHGLELGKDFAKEKGFVQQFGDEVSLDLKKFADYHLDQLRNYWRKEREKSSVSKYPGAINDFEDLVFNFGSIKVRMAITKKDKKTQNLECFWGMKGDWCCHFCYRLKAITNN